MLSGSPLKALVRPARVLPFREVKRGEQNDSLHPAVIVAAALVFVFRLFIMVKFPLTGDEAYYWLWAKHLSLGYHDHPPLIGWLIALTTTFSNGIFWTRLPALVCSTGAAIFFYAFAREFLGSPRKAGIALIFFLLLPILGISSEVIFPDTPLIFCWTLALWAGWRALRDGRYWPLTGLALGLGILSKLMAFFLVASFMMFFAMNRKSRFWLTQKSFWIGAAVCPLVSLPFWIWNVRHHFENFLFQAQDHLALRPVHPFYSFLGYLGLQSVSVTPFVFLLFLPALYLLFKRSRQRDARAQFLLAFFFPIHAFFAVMAFHTDAGIHWAVAGYLTLLVAAADLEGWDWLKSLGVANCVVFSLLFYAVFSFPVLTVWAIQPLNREFPSWGVNHFLKGKDFGELLGYRELAADAGKRLDALTGKSRAFILTDSYSLSSVLSYYSGKPSRTLLLTGQGGEFARWNNFGSVVGENALWVGLSSIPKDPRDKTILEQAFGRVGAEEKIFVKSGPLAREFYSIPLYGLKDPRVLSPKAPGVP